MTDAVSEKAPKEFWASPGKYRALVFNDEGTGVVDCGEFFELITAKDEAVKMSIVHLGNAVVVDEHGDVVH